MRSIPLLVLASVFMAGCSSRPPLAGTWKLAKPVELQMGPISATFDSGTLYLSGDGKSSSELHGKSAGQKFTVKVDSDYTVAEKQITMVPTSMEAMGRKMDLTDPAYQVYKEQSTTIATFEFLSYDKLKISSQQATLIYDRVK